MKIAHICYSFYAVYMKVNSRTILTFSCLFLLSFAFSQSSIPLKAPPRKEGDGPWDQLIIRGVTLINGTLAPPMGPVDIVVEKNRIVSVQVVGTPGLPVDSTRRPKLKPGGKELNATGMYLMPGFVDTHGHIGGAQQGANAEYVFKLWMAGESA